jgi:hypothetical protein
MVENRKIMALPHKGDSFYLRAKAGDDVASKFTVKTVEHHLDDVGNAGHEIVIELD